MYVSSFGRHVFYQLLDLYANLLNFFHFNFAVLFISFMSNTVSEVRILFSPKGEILPRNFYWKSLIHLNECGILQGKVL